MTDKETDIFADPPFSNLSGAREPVWYWDSAAGAILWANRAGLAFWGARDLASLKERRFDRAMPALSRLRNYAVPTCEHEPKTERLLFWTNDGNRAALCHFEEVRLENSEAGILLRVLDEEAGDTVNGARRFAEAQKSMNGHSAENGDDRATLQEIARLIKEGDSSEGEADEAEALDEPVSDIGQTDLFAKISHEVRTPLNSILGFSELMKEESFGPIGNDKYKGYVKDIHLSAQHALSLINDLLDISKVHAGEFELDMEDVEVNMVAEECVSAMEPIARKAEINMHAVLGKSLSLVKVDKRTLKQILLNLLSNSLKFTERGGSVDISTFQGHLGTVTIRVEDSGIGMSEEEVLQAFKPFRQLDTAPRPQMGTGLGLPLARALTEANGAFFDLTSETGKGTRVDLVFKPSR